MENLDAGRMMQHYAAAQHSAYLNALDPGMMMSAAHHHHHQQQQQQHQQGVESSQHQSMEQQQQSMGEQQGPQLGEGGSGMRGHADISTILDQIMNITDQSLDEAQVIGMLTPSQTVSTANAKSKANLMFPSRPASTP